MGFDGGAIHSAPASPRLHWIDWLRVLAVVGIVVYHTLRPFDLTGWHVKNAETSDLLGVAQIFLSTFGLAVLFLVAGAGVQFALRRRSSRAFLRERTARLLVPFVVGTLLLSPVQWFIDSSNHGVVSGQVPDFVAWWTRVAPAMLAADGFSPEVFGIGYHLWFLGFLFAFSVIGLPICQWLRQGDGARRVASLAGWVDARRGSTLAFAGPLLLTVLVFAAMGTDEHDWVEFGQYFAYFLAGFLLLADPRFLAAVRRDAAIAVAVAVASTAALLALDFTGWSTDAAARGVDPRSLAIVCAFVLEGWAWTLVVLNVAMRVPRLQRPLSPAVGDAVLPVYVIHQPVILVVASVVVQWSAGILPKWLAVLGLSAAVTLLLAELALRNRSTRMLLGARPGPPSAPPTGTPVASRPLKDAQRAGSH